MMTKKLLIYKLSILILFECHYLLYNKAQVTQQLNFYIWNMFYENQI